MSTSVIIFKARNRLSRASSDYELESYNSLGFILTFEISTGSR
jgi:hypothetical protein